MDCRQCRSVAFAVGPRCLCGIVVVVRPRRSLVSPHFAAPPRSHQQLARRLVACVVSIDQPTNQPTNQPPDQPTDQPTNRPTILRRAQRISSFAAGRLPAARRRGVTSCTWRCTCLPPQRLCDIHLLDYCRRLLGCLPPPPTTPHHTTPHHTTPHHTTTTPP